MGIILCQTHGRQGLASVSAAVQEALRARARWSPHEFVRVRANWMEDDTYPLPRMWLDRETVGDIDDRVLSFAESCFLAPGHACDECLKEWLISLGLDLTLPEEEQRFVRLRDDLQAILRAPLQAAIDALARSLFDRHRAGGLVSFQPSRSRPFCALVHVNEASMEMAVGVSRHDDHLTGTLSWLGGPEVPPDLALIEVPLADGELEQEAGQAISVWGAKIAQFLNEGTATSATGR